MSLLLDGLLPAGVSEREACSVLNICRNSWRAARARNRFCGPISPYRRKRKETQQPRALSAEERTEVREVLSSAEFHDQPPAQVYFSLLEQGRKVGVPDFTVIHGR